jgi:hypothetical protein
MILVDYWYVQERLVLRGYCTNWLVIGFLETGESVEQVMAMLRVRNLGNLAGRSYGM